MSYNRWMPPECSTELYHHGVKGMKWGKHLFGKGADVQAGAGGGGGGDFEDDELNIALEKFKRGEITEAELNAVYKKIQSLPYRMAHEPLDVLNDAAVKTIHAVSDAKDAITHPDETASKAIHKGQELAENAKEKLNGITREKRIPEKKNAEEIIKEKRTGPADKGKSFYEQNKDKMHHKSGDMDTDARVRKYTAEGRERYRQNGKYRNMNLTDVYGENSKVNNRVGRNGANLYKHMDVDDVHGVVDYSTQTRSQNLRVKRDKYNDGRYTMRDKVREKLTGSADPDHLKRAYNDYVRDFDRSANQKQAFSVGMEEQYIRGQAKKHTDSVDQKVYDKSLAGLVDKVTKKKKRRW